ncbi:unnamed protein product [Amoebophrya sp. A120]|nr:unnamed protein product [Amoebophrya sp. A120]|eukprot:GSA120T00002446001.1
MQKLEDRFAEEPNRAFLVGDQLTIADVRLFQTLVRMDECYVIYFKCYAASLRNFPFLLRYTVRIYQMPEVQACTFVRDCKIHYFTSHPHLNAFAVVPRDSQVVELLEQPPDTLIYSKSGASKGLLGFLRDFFTKRIC